MFVRNQNFRLARTFRLEVPIKYPYNSEYEKEVLEIENNILQHYKPNAFCHNDLHNKNLKKLKNKIYLIDFDHADYGFRGYDLAYYLLHCGHSQTKAGFQNDASQMAFAANQNEAEGIPGNQ